MMFTPSAMRLETRLSLYAVCLTPSEMSQLDSTLRGALQGADLPRLKKAAHLLRTTLTQMGKPVPQALAFEAVSAYLGAKDWNTLRTSAADSFLDIAATHGQRPCVFERDGQSWARFVYTVQSKTLGFGNLAMLGKSFPGIRLRLVSVVGDVIDPILAGWNRLYASSGSPVLVDIANERTATLAALCSQQEAAGMSNAVRTMRHHIVVELPVYQDSATHEGARQDEADAPTLSESLQRQLEPRLSRSFNAGLTLTPDTIDVPWFDCSSLPEGRIQPWWHHYISAVKTRQQKWTDQIPAGRSFNAFVDVQFENTGNYTYESVMAHGVVVPRAGGDSRPAPDQPRTASDVGGLSWKAPSGERAQDILQSSPMFAPYLGSDGSGLLVVEKGHGLTRYAPWGDAGRAENFAVVGSSGSGKSFLGREIATSAYVEGKRLRIVDGFDYYEYMHRVLDAPTYRLDPKAPISLNPFSGISTEAELERLLPALSSLVLELADQQDDEGLEYVSIAVREAWLLAGEQLDLSYISSNIASRAGTALERVQDSLDKLLASCGKWLSGLPGIPLSPRALLIDTQALSHGHGEAHRCALKLIMGLLHREALADGNAVHLYDEIFHIRPTDWYARRLVADCNKKGVSIGIFGQDLRSEILLSGLGQAVCATSPSYLTSHLRPQCREQLQWYIGLTESEVAEIESCGWRLGDFSVVKDGKLRGQFQFLVDPLTRAAYSTQYETIDALRKLMENSGLSYREALRHVGG